MFLAVKSKPQKELLHIRHTAPTVIHAHIYVYPAEGKQQEERKQNKVVKMRKKVTKEPEGVHYLK